MIPPVDPGVVGIAIGEELVNMNVTLYRNSPSNVTQACIISIVGSKVDLGFEILKWVRR
tara:strand:- start:274 stop:450 length:177 start_codon:yes stop_codon:yes gene_type:complete